MDKEVKQINCLECGTKQSSLREFCVICSFPLVSRNKSKEVESRKKDSEALVINRKDEKKWLCYGCNRNFSTLIELEKHEELCSSITDDLKANVGESGQVTFSQGVGLTLLLFFVFFAIIAMIPAEWWEDDSDYSWQSSSSGTWITTSLTNTDDVSHVVHVYIDGDYVGGERVSAGQMVWIPVCPDRCPNGEYVVSVDWLQDGVFDCSVKVYITGEGDTRTVYCDY